MIPFNKPYLTGLELGYIAHAHELGGLSGDGSYTRRCHEFLESELRICKALLTHSCTAALEMMPILANIKNGDEIIMPSYTFVSTANAFVLRGAIPVFVDIREDTFNINENLIEEAINPRTRAIVPVHYAGVGCEMEEIIKIASRYNLWVFEDAAQGILARYRGRELGSIGHLGAFSFHETKNVMAGEGGALLINHDEFIARAEVIREKGTNRSQFFRGQVDKYTWNDIGSSYLPGEVVAAFLYAQLTAAREITTKRLAAWNRYHVMLEGLEGLGFLRRPIVPVECEHNGHMYHIIVEDLKTRTELIKNLREKQIMALFHYVPLHSSPAGIKFGRSIGDMRQTQLVSETLIRLPLYTDILEAEQEKIVNAIYKFFGK